MVMTSRERMLTALANGHPDRLPCRVHGWMEAYDRFGFGHALYIGPFLRSHSGVLPSGRPMDTNTTRTATTFSAGITRTSAAATSTGSGSSWSH